MRINIDIQPLLHEKTGIGQYIYQFLQGLQRLDHNNEYILTYFSIKGKHVEIPLDASNFTVNRKRMLPGRVLEKLWKTLNWPSYDSLSGNADIFHFPNFIIHPVRRGRLIATVHDLSFKRFPQYTEPGNLVYLTKCFEKTLQRADHLIADSYSTKEQIIEDYDYPENMISVVYLGVADTFRLIDNKNTTESVRKKYNLPARYVFYLGTIEPRKNLKTLFKAFSELKNNNQFRDLKLVLTGMKGWRLEQVYGPLKQNNIERDVIFTGYVPDDDLPALYSMAELFVFPSLYEGFGLPPLEAMACGIPVISSDSPSLPEVLGDAALFFDPNSPEELEQKMTAVLTDEAMREDLSKKGIKHAQNYKWEKTAKGLLKVYEAVFHDGK